MPRSTYAPSGGGPVAVLLDLRLGIAEGRYTPQMTSVMTRSVAVLPEEEAVALLADTGMAAVSKATLHRVPRAIAGRYETRRAQIQEELRESDEVPDAAVTVQASIDGVMVPQDGEYAKARGRPTETPQGPRHETHYAPLPTALPIANDGKVGRAWHEASVGTISYWDKDGEHLRTIYFARMPEPGKGTLADEIEDELNLAVARRPDLHVQCAAEGPCRNNLLISDLRYRRVRIDRDGEV